MPIVHVREEESFENALRRFKRKCEKAGVLTELKKRQHFEKPSVKRKRKAIQAKKMVRARCRRSGGRASPEHDSSLNHRAGRGDPSPCVLRDQDLEPRESFCKRSSRRRPPGSPAAATLAALESTRRCWRSSPSLAAPTSAPRGSSPSRRPPTRRASSPAPARARSRRLRLEAPWSRPVASRSRRSFAALIDEPALGGRDLLPSACPARRREAIRRPGRDAARPVPGARPPLRRLDDPDAAGWRDRIDVLDRKRRGARRRLSELVSACAARSAARASGSTSDLERLRSGDCASISRKRRSRCAAAAWC